MTYKDMDLCKGIKCPFKDKCQRHKYYNEGVGLNEQMLIFAPELKKNGECDFFILNNQIKLDL